MKLKLIVLRTSDLEKSVHFYQTLLDCTFDYHNHNQGVFHFSTLIQGVVFEIYPLLKNQATPDITTRLGFEVNDFDSKIQLFETSILNQPQTTEFGTFAILKDPDGRKIEVYNSLIENQI
jgi:lactoylglutathione lyase